MLKIGHLHRPTSTSTSFDPMISKVKAILDIKLVLSSKSFCTLLYLIELKKLQKLFEEPS